MTFTLVWRGSGESLEGSDPSIFLCMRSTLFYGCCGESLEGVDPRRIHRMMFYNSLLGLWCILEGCPPFKDSPH